jgi:hypothetical protein
MTAKKVLLPPSLISLLDSLASPGKGRDID